MAEDTAEEDQYRAINLELLRSGDFSDVEVVCGERSWKCHRAILASRSGWFRKALSGANEANPRRIILKQHHHVTVDLALKHIYGLGFDVESSVSPRHFVIECVSFYRTAELLELKSLQSSLEKAIRSYCDKRMKQLCTRGSGLSWAYKDDEWELNPWALDLVLGTVGTYQWHIPELKGILMEFIWVGRECTLVPSVAPIIFHYLKNEPAFMEDLISWYSTGLWLQDPHWAAFGRTEIKDHWNNVALKCARCGKDLSHQTAEEMEGQIENPFKLEGNIKDEAGWCRDCGQLDMIPWRN